MFQGYFKTSQPELIPSWLQPDSQAVAMPLQALLHLQGEPVAWLENRTTSLPVVIKVQNNLKLNYDPDRVADIFTSESYLKLKPPLMSLFPGKYHIIPEALRFRINRFFSRRTLKAKGFPLWPLDVSSGLWLHLANRINLLTPYPWEAGKSHAVVFTHDVDTLKGMRHMAAIADIENECGIQSTWFMVTQAYPLDHGLLQALHREGHELGCHSCWHDLHLPWLKPAEVRMQLSLNLKALEAYQPQGFRSPCMLRAPGWHKFLSEFFVYDSSVPDTERFAPYWYPNGCGYFWPFTREGIKVLPLTMPQDAFLLFLGYSPERILELWRAKLKVIKALGGMAVFSLHPETHFSGNPLMHKIYRQLLQEVTADRQAWVATAAAVASWHQRSIIHGI